jgi:hypothetical protein
MAGGMLGDARPACRGLDDLLKNRRVGMVAALLRRCNGGRGDAGMQSGRGLPALRPSLVVRQQSGPRELQAPRAVCRHTQGAGHRHSLLRIVQAPHLSALPRAP